MIIILLILPLLAILTLSIVPREKVKMLDSLSLFWSLLQLVTFIILWLFNLGQLDFQQHWIVDWISLNFEKLYWGNIIITCDSISLFFIGLSIILIPLCILISIETINKLRKEFYVLLFTILLLLVGVFSVMDIIGFYILFEGILIPMFIIIGVWGSREEKVKAAFYFFFYTLIGSLLLLVSIFKLYSLTGTTLYLDLLTYNIDSNLQFWMFLGFFASLSVKIPMVPFHIWLPQAHVEAPVSGSVLLAGILLKLGGYGFIRFSYPLFPIASEYFTPFIIILSLVAIIYGSFTTCRQSDVKRLIAYSSVAHMGLVTLAIFTHSFQGVIASILMMLAHGFVSSGLFMTTSVLYIRHHSRIIKYYRGLVTVMPIFSSLSLILILGNISFPLTFNFIAEFISITVAFQFSTLVGVLSSVGILLGTVYSLYLYNRIHFGLFSSYIGYTRDCLKYEYWSVLPLVLLTLLLGIKPGFILHDLLIPSYMNISL